MFSLLLMIIFPAALRPPRPRWSNFFCKLSFRTPTTFDPSTHNKKKRRERERKEHQQQSDRRRTHNNRQEQRLKPRTVTVTCICQCTNTHTHTHTHTHTARTRAKRWFLLMRLIFSSNIVTEWFFWQYYHWHWGCRFKFAFLPINFSLFFVVSRPALKVL